MSHDPHATRASRMALPGTRLLLYRVWIVVGAIIIAATVLNVMGVLAPMILFLVVGSLVAFIESPIVNALDQRGVPRGLAAFIGLVVVVAAIVCLFMVVIPVFINQMLEVFAQLPDQLRDLGNWVVDISHRFASLSSSSSSFASQLDRALGSLADLATNFGTDMATNFGRGIVPFISGFTSTLFLVFLGLVLAYWLALDYPRIHREIGMLLGEGKEANYRLVVAVISSSMGGYMRGMVVTSLVNGVLAWIGLAIIGHPYAALMGVLTGLLHLIPVIGPAVSAGVASIIALFYQPMMAVWTLVWTMVAQNVTDNVISPKVMQSSVQVHPAMSLTALVIGSALMGPIGMVVAIPLSAAIKGVFVFYFETDTGRQLVSYDGAIFRGTPFHDAEGKPVPAFDALGDDRFVGESRIVDEDATPEAHAMPKPKADLENPWDALSILHRLEREGKGAHDSAADGGPASSDGAAGSRDGRPAGDGPTPVDGSGADDSARRSSDPRG